MEFGILKEMIDVIRKEQERRALLLEDEDPGIARDQWLFEDEPFVNEMCLMVLVALRHQVERELVGLATRAADGRKEISGQQYAQEMEQLRKGKGWDWKKIEDRLKLKSCKGYKSLEALRLLANSYKHDPSMAPDKELLAWLKIEIGIKYASLPESDSLRKGLAALVGLDESATYCDISDQFFVIVSDFLLVVEGQTKLSRVKWGRISLNPKDFLH